MLPTKAFLAPMDEDEEIEVELAKGNTVVIKYKALSELQPNGRRCAPEPPLSCCSSTALPIPHTSSTPGRSSCCGMPYCILQVCSPYRQRRSRSLWSCLRPHSGHLPSSGPCQCRFKRLKVEMTGRGGGGGGACREVFFESNGVPRVVEVVDTTAADAAGSTTSAKAAREKASPTDDGSVGAPMAGEVIEVKIKPGARMHPATACVSELLTPSSSCTAQTVCSTLEKPGEAGTVPYTQALLHLQNIREGLILVW